MPYKIGRATTVILHDSDEQAVNELAKKRFEETGKYSRSETIRLLIRRGIEAMRKDGNV